MKNYALYLLFLCLAFIGCQKDIGETDADLTAKKDKKCNKCKVLYLPVNNIGHLLYDSIVFNYRDKYGNLNSIRTYNRTYPRANRGLDLIYDKNNKVSKVQLYPNTHFILVSYKADKIDKCEEYYINQLNDTIPNKRWTFTWNNEVLCKLKEFDFIQNSERIETFEYKSNTNASELLSIKLNELYYNELTSVLYSGKNYWAKDIKNKELLLITPFGFPNLILPVQKEISYSRFYRDYIFNARDRVTRLIEGDYNEAGFPTRVYYDDHDYYLGDFAPGDNDDWSATYKITYEKVIVNK
ncbi:hypothetical protein D3C72_878970 [compost metagenome]